MPTYVGAGASTISDALAVPVGRAAGDLLIATHIMSGNLSMTAVPAGWTLLTSAITRVNAEGRQMYVYTRIAGSAEPATYSWSANGSKTGVMFALRDVLASSVIRASAVGTQVGATSVVAPSVDVVHGDMLVVVAGLIAGAEGNISGSGGLTERLDTGAEAGGAAFWVGTETAGQVGPTGTRVVSWPGSATDAVAVSIAVRPANRAPFSPLLLLPNGEGLNKDATNRLSWQHSDPDGDGQAAYDLRYRTEGAASWTTLSGSTPNQYRDIPAGTFAAGSYEWQVRTYDTAGLVGAYSSSGFFTAASLPPGPAITAPINGETIGQATAALTWTAIAQQSYQVRKVADLGGIPDTASVLYDSGEVVNTTARSVTLAFNVNSRTEHLQVRVKDAGLFSPWSSVRVLVSYTPPAAPQVSVTPAQTATSDYTFTDAILVTLANPIPTGGQPAVTYLNLFCQATIDGDPYRPKLVPVRIGTLLPAGTFTDHAVTSGVDYLYAAEAVAANGTASLSSYIGETSVIVVGDEGDFEDDEFSTADFN